MRLGRGDYCRAGGSACQESGRVEQSAQETLGSYAWQDEDKGFVRIPIEQAMSQTVKEWQDAGEGRAELISRMEKATALPPPAPEEPSAFE